jgi:hypothetical protein
VASPTPVLEEYNDRPPVFEEIYITHHVRLWNLVHESTSEPGHGLQSTTVGDLLSARGEQPTQKLADHLSNRVRIRSRYSQYVLFRGDLFDRDGIPGIHLGA